MRVRADRRSGLLPEAAGRSCRSTRQVVLLVAAVGDCKVASLSRDGKSNSELCEVRKRYLWGWALPLGVGVPEPGVFLGSFGMRDEDR
jgi:hypothetical protein